MENNERDELFRELGEKVNRIFSETDAARIKEAYEYAYSAHDGQKRRDGTPYITHPLAVALIIADMGLDADSVIAGLLHDSVEDTPSTCDDINEHFGEHIAALVDGVTRLGKITYSSKEEAQMEDLRKMFLAMAKDIRVILIKLADRLHNMRTIGAMPIDKQRQKSLETMEIYAPIAHRLGMQKIKWELEDLSLARLDPIGYGEIIEDLRQKADEREAFLINIRSRIEERMREMGINGYTEGRVKHIYSIYRKMYLQHKSMGEIYDICAVRVIVETVTDCYNVLGFVHDLYKPVPGRFKDYISTPKPNHYSSLHTTVIGREGTPFEVQIRTFEMHHQAEYGVAAHWKYKQGIETNEDDKTFAWIRQLLEAQQDSDAEDFIKHIKVDLFADEVFVFTPKGDVINLPLGATPIDFAYAIHSAIGNRMTGAKVNGRIVQFDYNLQNGEIVEVLTSRETHGPSRDWLKIVKTGEARNKIKQWFKKERREENVAQGKEELERELKVNLLYNAFLQDDVRDAVLKKFSFGSLDELYAGIGYGGITVVRVMNRIREELTRLNRKQAKSLQEKTALQKRRKRSSGGVVVEGIESCLVKFARCCTPIPGDDIVGFITKGYGVSIHRADCVNASAEKREGADSDRWINVWWNNDSRERYATGLQIIGKSRIGLLADVAVVVSTAKTNVIELSAREAREGVTMICATVEVGDKDQLSLLADKLRKVGGVTEVSRMTGCERAV